MTFGWVGGVDKLEWGGLLGRPKSELVFPSKKDKFFKGRKEMKLFFNLE
jgi:hypothetical protein